MLALRRTVKPFAVFLPTGYILSDKVDRSHKLHCPHFQDLSPAKLWATRKSPFNRAKFFSSEADRGAHIRPSNCKLLGESALPPRRVGASNASSAL